MTAVEILRKKLSDAYWYGEGTGDYEMLDFPESELLETIAKIQATKECKHHLMQWLSIPGGCYKLHCAICGMALCSETYVPGTFSIFRSNSGFHLTAAPVDLADDNLDLAQPQVNPDR